MGEIAGLNAIEEALATNGVWSILQCVEHWLLQTSVIPGRSPEFAESTSGEWRNHTGIFGKIFLTKVEPPVTTKVSAPRQIAPCTSGSSADVLRAFGESHQVIRSLMAQGRVLNLKATKFRNPFIPLLRVRVGTGLLIMAAHERRHIWQAQQVRAALPEGS